MPHARRRAGARAARARHVRQGLRAARVLDLPSPLVVEIVRFTQRFAREHRWRAYHPSRHDGVARFLMVRHLPLTDECAVHLIAVLGRAAGLRGMGARRRRALARGEDGDARPEPLARPTSRSWSGRSPLVGDGAIVERLLGLEFEVVGNAFLQTNSAQAEQLYALALEAARLAGGETRARPLLAAPAR